MHPTFDIAAIYTLCAFPNISLKEISDAVTNMVNNLTVESYEEAMKKGDFKYDVISIYGTDTFSTLDDDMKNRLILDVNDIVDNKLAYGQKGFILENYLKVLKSLQNIDISLWNTILDIMLNNYDFDVLFVYDKLKDANYSNEDIKRYLKICAKFDENVVSIIADKNLKEQGVVDIILNGLVNIDLDVEHLEYVIDNILFYQKLEDAIPAVMALFSLPSDEHLSFVERLLEQNSVRRNPHLASFIRYVSFMNEEDLPLVEYEAKYEEGYHEMPFSRAAMEHNRVAMDYLDTHPGCNSTTLVRVPYRKERGQYKIDI